MKLPVHFGDVSAQRTYSPTIGAEPTATDDPFSEALDISMDMAMPMVYAGKRLVVVG